MEREDGKNPHEFSDKRAQKLSDLWFSQRETATVRQKDRVGTAYIEKVLNLGKEMAIRFVQGDLGAFHEVGMRQGGVTPYEPDFAGFWTEMRELFPGIYSDEDIKFLVEEGGVMAVWHLQWQLEIPLEEKSPVLRRLANNAHAYK